MRTLKILVVLLTASMACATAHADGMSYPRHEVARVVDGDTIDVVGLGRVRLIGIDAPESVHPRLHVQPCGLAASVYLHQQVYRRRVGIEVSPTANRDRYGRLLAYVHYRGLVNSRIVANGYATVETRWPFYRKQEFLMAQHYAKKRRLGIWNPRKCE